VHFSSPKALSRDSVQAFARRISRRRERFGARLSAQDEKKRFSFAEGELFRRRRTLSRETAFGEKAHLFAEGELCASLVLLKSTQEFASLLFRRRRSVRRVPRRFSSLSPKALSRGGSHLCAPNISPRLRRRDEFSRLRRRDAPSSSRRRRAQTAFGEGGLSRRVSRRFSSLSPKANSFAEGVLSCKPKPKLIFKSNTYFFFYTSLLFIRSANLYIKYYYNT